MVRRNPIDASDRGIGTLHRSRHRANLSGAVVLLTVVALAASSCTRPEDETSADASIAPVTDTGDSGDVGDSGELTDDTTSATTTSRTATTGTVATTTTTVDTGAAAEATDESAATTTTSSTLAAPPDDPSDLTLIFDGILPFRFGDRDVDVVPTLTKLLGPPAQDDLREYPDADQGIFLDASGEESFIARFGRTVCYDNGLCVQFGAGAPETLIFTGWRVDGASSGLTTDEGLSIGSTLDEFADVITFDPARSCYQVADGSAAGIDVTLLSDDGVFAAPASDGDGLVLGDPDPTAVTVIEMRAGQLPVFVFADC
jgi:hypothetical protein